MSGQRVSVDLGLLQSLVKIINGGSFTIPFGEISAVLTAVNQDAVLIEDLPKEKESPAE